MREMARRANGGKLKSECKKLKRGYSSITQLPVKCAKTMYAMLKEPSMFRDSMKRLAGSQVETKFICARIRT